MAEIPRYKDSNPIVELPAVASSAQGYEAFAKTLGAIGEHAAAKAEEIQGEQSNAMYINSVAQSQKIKTDAEIRMLKNPGAAGKIASQTAEQLDSVEQNAYVNSKDRSRLKAGVGEYKNAVALAAARTQVHQGQNEAAFTFYGNAKDKLAAYKEAAMTDPKKAQQLHDSMIGELHTLVSTGALTPHEAGAFMNTMGEVLKAADDDHQMMSIAQQGGNVTAREYQTAAAAIPSDAPPNPQSPVNQDTAWLVENHNDDMSFQGVKAGIVNRTINIQAFDNLKPAQRKEAIHIARGVSEADGMINSGEPYPALERDYKMLSEKNSVLSYKDQGKRDRLASYINNINSGNYWKAITNTPMGNGMLMDFNAKNAAIQNSPLDNDQKSQLMAENKNRLVSNGISYGYGHHIPASKIQPIPEADVAVAQNSFQKDQDPSQVLNVLSQYNKQNQPYLAQAMKNPSQRIAVQAVSLVGNDVSYQDKLDSIAAIQEGRSYVSKNAEGLQSDKTLQTRVMSNLKEPFRVISQNYDSEQAQTLQKAMIDNSMKLAKYLAQKDNNITMESGYLSFNQWKDYVDKATNIYTKSYVQQSGSNWSVNKNQLPEALTNHDLDTLAEYAITKGNDYLNTHLGEQRYNQMSGRGSLKMVITPTNDVQAVNANGDVAFTIPYSTNLMEHAREELKKFKAAEQEKTRKLTIEQIERSNRQRMNVRLPSDANTQ